MMGRICPSCGMRYTLGPPRSYVNSDGGADVMLVRVPPQTVHMMMSLAAEFDEQAAKMTPDTCYTAVDFMDWVAPTLKEGT